MYWNTFQKIFCIYCIYTVYILHINGISIYTVYILYKYFFSIFLNSAWITPAPSLDIYKIMSLPQQKQFGQFIFIYTHKYYYYDQYFFFHIIAASAEYNYFNEHLIKLHIIRCCFPSRAQENLIPASTMNLLWLALVWPLPSVYSLAQHYVISYEKNAINIVSTT